MQLGDTRRAPKLVLYVHGGIFPSAWIARPTHLMQLEESRYALYRETEAVLLDGDRP
jgi:hypothetical protein